MNNLEAQIAQMHSLLDTITRQLSRIESIVSGGDIGSAAKDLRANGDPVSIDNIAEFFRKAGEKVPSKNKIRIGLLKAGYRKVINSEYYV